MSSRKSTMSRVPTAGASSSVTLSAGLSVVARVRGPFHSRPAVAVAAASTPKEAHREEAQLDIDIASLYGRARRRAARGRRLLSRVGSNTAPQSFREESSAVARRAVEDADRQDPLCHACFLVFCSLRRVVGVPARGTCP